MLGQGSPISAERGQLGSVIINDTTAVTGNFGEIHCLAATVFALLTSGKLADGTTACTTASDAGTLANAMGTMAAGTTIKGLFTAITLTSGKVIAYKV